MQQRNILSGFLATVLSQFYEFMLPLAGVFLAAVILILVDLRFGVAAARKRGETIRFSRAVRRTLNKMADYLCWILLAGVIGQTFGEPFGIPVLPLLILLVIFGCEINSCYANYFEVRGKRMRVNIFKLFAKKADIIEPEEVDTNDNNDKK